MKNSLRILLSLLGLCLTQPVLPVLAECRFPKEVVDTAQEWLTAGYGTATVLATVDAKGMPCYRKLGAPAIGSLQPLDEHTLFEIGSITKVFTALTLAQFVIQGKVRLNDAYQTLVPEARQPLLADRPITLADLATHRSGLPRLPDNFQPNDITNPYAEYSLSQLWDFLAQYKLTRKVGSQYLYSNLGYGLLGEALCHKAGQSYETLVQEQVIQPLGLKDTGITLTPTQRGGRRKARRLRCSCLPELTPLE